MHGILLRQPCTVQYFVLKISNIQTWVLFKHASNIMGAASDWQNPIVGMGESAREQYEQGHRWETETRRNDISMYCVKGSTL